MKKNLKYGVLFIAILFASYWMTLIATPYVILLAIKTGAKSSLNQPVYANVMTDKDRQVVMPNPDFLYVVCGFDIRKSPIKITGTMPKESYGSIALYADNTLNFYIQNDQNSPDKKVDILLIKKGDEHKFENAKEKIIVSPTSIGVMLVRILINDTSNLNYYKDIQHSFLIQSL